MAVEDGAWIMRGLDWDDPSRTQSWEELIGLIDEVGFLPMFKKEVTLQMDENFVLTDDSDPDTPPQVYTAEELFAIRDRLIGEFKPYNTAVTVKNEKIISIYRKFMP